MFIAQCTRHRCRRKSHKQSQWTSYGSTCIYSCSQIVVQIVSFTNLARVAWNKIMVLHLTEVRKFDFMLRKKNTNRRTTEIVCFIAKCIKWNSLKSTAVNARTKNSRCVRCISLRLVGQILCFTVHQTEHHRLRREQFYCMRFETNQSMIDELNT